MIPTRAGFDDRCDQEWRRGNRSAAPLSLLMIEVDGTGTPDASLHRVAAVLQDNLSRPGDCAARFADARFAVLLPGTDMVGTLIVAETLRKAVEALDAAPRMTVSLGATSLVPTREPALPSLIAAAEKALAAARQAGGNRVEHATPA